MDLTVPQSALSRALRLVGRVTPTRPTLPILQMVLLSAEPGRLRLTATDADLAMTTAIAADVTREGRVAIPARLLGEYVAQLPAEPVQLALDAKRQRVRAACGPYVANMATAEPDEFPAFPGIDEHSAVDFDAGRLKAAIERVAFAAARDESRPVLSGVLFELGAEGLTLAAADGFRLARARIAEATGPATELLVPARAVGEFARLLADAEAARLVLAPEGRGVALIVGDTVLYTRLIEGRFPEIERLIPQECLTRVTVETAALRQAVRVAGLFGSGEARPVRLDAAADRLHLQARAPETGDAESDLPAVLEGEPQAIVLNTRLLADLLDAAAGERLELRWSSPQTPVVIRDAARTEASDLWLLMPLFEPALTRRETQQPQEEPQEQQPQAA